jgi:hypothetical protein
MGNRTGLKLRSTEGYRPSWRRAAIWQNPGSAPKWPFERLSGDFNGHEWSTSITLKKQLDDAVAWFLCDRSDQCCVDLTMRESCRPVRGGPRSPGQRSRFPSFDGPPRPRSTYRPTSSATHSQFPAVRVRTSMSPAAMER